MTVDALSVSALLSVLLLAVLHTAIGPDHYVPFVMLGRARRWSVRKTLAVTAACGVGHVGSSLALGVFGLGAGAAVSTVFSAAPYYLQFVGRNGLVLGSTAVAVAVSIVLCFVLGRPRGSLGAAVAYAVPLAALFATLRVLGFRHLRSHW